MKTKEYYECSWCGNNYKGIILTKYPGTRVSLPKHSRWVNRLGNDRHKEICPGSHHILIRKEINEDRFSFHEIYSGGSGHIK
jgi:hypothetical protein